MRCPSPIGSRIDQLRMRTWLGAFEGYRVSISQGAVDRWIDQFERKDRDLAARILDSVDFINLLRIQAAFRSLLQSLEGWNLEDKRRIGKWHFVPFSGSSGSSADSMIHLFRIANRLTHRRYDPLFIYRRDLLQELYTDKDTIVFIDDFAGTGEQACEAWRTFFSEIIPREPRKILLLVAGAANALDRIKVETDLNVCTDILLGESDNIFHNTCSQFTDGDKKILIRYCIRADKKNPRGYGDCGFVIVFPYRCPNNSIPILHVSHSRWFGLFPRHE